MNGDPVDGAGASWYESAMRSPFAISLLVLLAGQGLAQTPARPAFEVASLKPNPNCRVTGGYGAARGRLELPCVSLRGLIRMAYGGLAGEELNTRLVDAVGGPAWLDSERYQLIAKAEGPASSGAMLGPMLQRLLEERLQLKVHVEARETPVFRLTVVKSGKLTTAKQGGCVAIDLSGPPKPDASGAMPKYCGGGSMRGSPRGTIADVPGATMQEFAGRLLTALMGRPVVDETGLAGRYDLHFEFTREAPVSAATQLNGEPAPALPPPPADGFPSIFTALQEQLGLKLTAGKAPIDVIVVDSATKPVPD